MRTSGFDELACVRWDKLVGFVKVMLSRQSPDCIRFPPKSRLPVERVPRMLNFWNTGKLDRREMLRVGGLALTGLSLPQLLQQQAFAKPAARSFGKAKSCI